MHRSRLAGFIIDCRTADLGTAADFWSRAPGMPRHATPAEEPDKYLRLEALGARRVEQVKARWVMETPTGRRFRVVRRFSPAFDQRADPRP